MWHIFCTLSKISYSQEVSIMYITITGSKHYLGVDSYKIGQELILKKDIGNIYDDEAIKVESETGVMCGYVANSVESVARGTHSAGYIYNTFSDGQKCKVSFVSDEKVIAEIIK